MEKIFYKTQEKPPQWANSLTEEEIIQLVKNGEFAEKQLNEGKEFCYYLSKVIHTSQDREIFYCNMIWTLTEPETLKAASSRDCIVSEEDVYEIYRIGVVRQGKYLDKTADLNIRVFDFEEETEKGVVNKQKKINISIKDLRLNDTIVVEDAIVTTFTEKEFVARDFSRYIWVSPDPYWAYGQYHFKAINDREKDMVCKSVAFKDDKGNLMPDSEVILKKGETFCFDRENYTNQIDTSREIVPFINLATNCSWEELADYINPIYKPFLDNKDLSFAPELTLELEKISSLEDKIRYGIEYVQNNICYCYDANVMNGHLPQHPRETYEKKQGDCKAKSLLLHTIFNYLGVKSNLVLVNYDSDFFLKYYVPSLRSFNHMILKVQYNEKDYFIDSSMQNQYGLLTKRGQPSFRHFFEIDGKKQLQIVQPFVSEKYPLEEKAKFEVIDSVGYLNVKCLLRYHRADHVRSIFKNRNYIKILDDWRKSYMNILGYFACREEMDERDVFLDAKVEVVRDDLRENELEILFKAKVQNPYFTDRKGDKFLTYWDRGYLKDDLLEYNFQAPFRHNYDRYISEVELIADKKIDTKEKLTNQEIEIKNKYFSYSTKKEIGKNSGKITMKYNPISEIDIPLEELEDVKKDYRKIANSNYGIGIDIIGKKSLFERIKSIFR